MAKSGGRRAYARDSRGRFASTPGSAAKKAAKSQSGRASTLQARSSLKRSRAKLAAKDKADETLQGMLGRKAQKGAVTRGSRELAGAQTAAQARISGGKKGVVGKPKGLKPGALAARRAVKPSRATNRTKEEQAKRDQIAGALKRMPKERRNRAIKIRREMEAESASSGSAKKPSTQKERWAQRSEVYSRAAARNREKAADLEGRAGGLSRDYAFNTQPGSFPARKRANAQLDKAFQLRQKAKGQEQRAAELTRLATTNKGDAERARQAKRDAVSVAVGSKVKTALYGPGEIVRVNKKTVSYRSAMTGSIVRVDKSWLS